MSFLLGILVGGSATVLGGLLLAFILRPRDTRNRLNRFRWWVIDGILRRNVQRCPECGSENHETVDFHQGTSHRMGREIAWRAGVYLCSECDHRWTNHYEQEVE